MTKIIIQFWIFDGSFCADSPIEWFCDLSCEAAKPKGISLYLSLSPSFLSLVLTSRTRGYTLRSIKFQFQISRAGCVRDQEQEALTMKRVFGVKKNKDPPPSVQDASEKVRFISESSNSFNQTAYQR